MEEANHAVEGNRHMSPRFGLAQEDVPDHHGEALLGRRCPHRER